MKEHALTGLRFGLWHTLGGLHPILVFVCRFMARREVRRYGTPDCTSAHNVIRLWRHVYDRERWDLSDGTALLCGDPVFEMHIGGEWLVEQVALGVPWREVIQRELASLAPKLARECDAAIVGRTLMHKQVLEFGGDIRELPGSVYRALDTFYKRLILLAMHPGGAKRLLHERQPIAEAAISLAKFCNLYG